MPSIGVAQALRQVKMFSSIWMKVSGVFAAIAGLFFIVIRYQSNKIGNLEHVNKTMKKKEEMRESQDTFAAKVLADECDAMLKIAKEVKDDDKKPSLDSINNL